MNINAQLMIFTFTLCEHGNTQHLASFLYSFFKGQLRDRCSEVKGSAICVRSKCVGVRI